MLPTKGLAVACVVLQTNAPPVHILAAFVGSWVNGVMNRKLPAASVIPLVNDEKLEPPLSDRAMDLPVFSAHNIFVLPGLMATNPPSPPRTLLQALRPPAM